MTKFFIFFAVIMMMAALYLLITSARTSLDEQALQTDAQFLV